MRSALSVPARLPHDPQHEAKRARNARRVLKRVGSHKPNGKGLEGRGVPI